MKRSAQFAFALLIATSLVIWWHSLATTLRLAWQDEAYTHILLIVPLSLALIYLNREKAPRPSKVSPPDGVPLLAAALLLAVLAQWGLSDPHPILRLSLSMLGLVLWWIASVRCCFGAATLRAFRFPLFFLFWMVPLPPLVLNRIVEALEHGSALSARFLFWIAHVPLTQDDLVLSIPGLDLLIAPECSSIRSSTLLVVTTMVLAQVFLHSGWRRLLLIAVSLPLSVAKNGLRIFVIAELGTRVDRGFLDGRLHHHGGIVFFGIAVLVIVALLWLLLRDEASSQRLGVPAEAK